MIFITFYVAHSVCNCKDWADTAYNKILKTETEEGKKTKKWPEEAENILTGPEYARINFVDDSFWRASFEDPCFLAVVFDSAPPSESYEESACYIFDSPEIKCQHWNDDDVSECFVTWE